VTLDEIRATATATVEPETPPTESAPGDSDDSDETPTTTTPTQPSAGDSRSSKYFLQAGAFNLNSTNQAAWAAVLRGVRFPAPQSFTYLNVSAETGTAADSVTAGISSPEARFFRFSQSAQETYKAEKGLAAPEDDTITSPNTHLFRQGMRTLTNEKVAALALKITELNAAKHAASDSNGGPFRSLEEFLAPSTLFAGVDGDGNVGVPRSLLEAAIADTGINEDIEFSSQWLSQGDIMTALAPILFVRSDTFVVRTYGEAVNPATNAVEGKAWAEAIVQRVPEYFADPANNPPEKLPSAFDVPVNPDDSTSGPTATDRLNQTYGRRFKVISFRWLTRSDI
jgi:hypothetical protein